VRLVPEIPGVPDDAAGLRAANARLRELLAVRDAEIAVLRGQVAELGMLRARAAELLAEAAGLQAQVADLAARVGQNSQNSSKPPSSDGLAKPAPKSLRKVSGRKPGRPKGQPGATMALTDSPDRRVRHVPSCCAGCGESLSGAAETGMERRQVTEIPPVKAVVTEHQLIELECGGCGAQTKGAAPAGVTAPVQYGPRFAAMGVYLWHGQFLSRDRACRALADLLGCAPSPGALGVGHECR
jgi:transposase